MGVTYTTGSASTYTPITSYTAPSSQTSITLNSFTGYTDLEIVLSCNAASTAYHVFFQCNGDTGTNYSYTILGGDGTTAGSTRASSQTSGRITYYAAVRSGSPTIIRMKVMNYANSTTYKTILSRSDRASDGAETIVNLWRGASTAAITSIVLQPYGANFDTGTTVNVYGIKAAG